MAAAWPGNDVDSSSRRVVRCETTPQADDIKSLMDSSSIVIRPARASDAAALSALVTELGFPADETTTEERLRAGARVLLSSLLRDHERPFCQTARTLIRICELSRYSQFSHLRPLGRRRESRESLLRLGSRDQSKASKGFRRNRAALLVDVPNHEPRAES